MPHLHRFYIDPGMNTENEVLLTGDEAHHALHVVRLSPGDEVALFNGCGAELRGEVTRCAKREALIRIVSRDQEPPPKPRLTLAQAWLLRDKPIEFLIQHGTEIGVTRFCFFRAEHSERPPKPHDKWRRLAIEVCKQCGRRWLPVFETADSLENAIDAAEGVCLAATMDLPSIAWPQIRPDHDYTVFVGPEGDFTAAEIERLRAAGAQPCSLGQTTFRSEMAALLAATLIRHRQGMLGSIDNA